jgi:hypothetical protein
MEGRGVSTFKAKYGGRCAAECGEQIRPGNDVVYVDDQLVHVGCEERALTPRRPAVVCTECWLEKPCECDDEEK